MRSTEYDTVSERYARFLRDEILAEVSAQYNLRKDAYSRAITGLSSGGICSFNAAWQMPDQFSRVISWIGSFTSIQWKEDPAIPDGGQDYPEKILREPARNLRVWLQDGANDQENDRYGSWPLANIRMANALEVEELRFSFQLWPGNAQLRPRRSRVSGGDDLALARLRSSEDQPGIRNGPGGKNQAALPGGDHQPGRALTRQSRQDDLTGPPPLSPCQ